MEATAEVNVLPKKEHEEAYPTGAAKWILVITAISCAVLELIDTTVVNVSLREISGNIGATTTEIAWVITAYGIANVIVIPLSGMLSNLFGRRIYFTASVIIFTFSSLMCGLSANLWTLVFWRFIQGIGGGGLLSTAQSIILGAFPPKETSKGMAIYGVGIIIGPTVGPVLGGYITDNFSWHWIFFINVPIGTIAAILASRHVTNLPGVTRPDKIDWWGIVFLIIGIGSLQYVLEEGGINDWFESDEIIFFFITAMVGLVAFVIRELSIDYPAVNLRLYRSFNLAMGNILNVIVGLILTVSVFIFPLFTQVSLGWTATQTGAFMIPGALATAVGMILVSKLLSKDTNPKIMMLTGLSFTSTFLILLSFSGPDSSERNFFWPFILRGVGMAFMMMPTLTLAVAGLKGKDLAQATGLSNMLRQLGGAIGVALINIYLDNQNADVRSNMVTNISDYSSLSSERINTFSQLFSSAGYSTDEATKAANMVMDGLVTKQQMLICYDHVFLMLGLIVLLCAPVMLLIKYKKGQKLEAVSDH
ncbi:MAG: DHA2 family efflux MFS transporter permease subunit [Bacteroidetes bacterium]|nr:DHA2 family efflux MFS transporter permease subunit [Bacteroidota bacterium]